MGLQVPMSLPAGSVSAFAGSVAPEGWLLMAGQAVSRATYGALFLAIGTTYGAGDGSTTFNIPDARGRALFGADNMGGSAANRLTTGGGGVNGAALGAVGGGQSVTLTAAQMPSHNHILGHATNAAPDGGRYGYTDTGVGVTRFSYSAGPDGRSPLTSSNGSSSAHANIPPAIVVNYIIKT